MLEEYHVKYQAKCENIEKNKAIFYKLRRKSAKYYTHSGGFHATIKENFLSTARAAEDAGEGRDIGKERKEPL